MASDQRWTGGIANREWQSGTRMTAPVDGDLILAQVREYLRDCRQYSLLASEDMAVKVTWGPQAAVRQAYQRLTQAARGAVTDG